MIVLDTNVLSEPLKRVPDAGVLEWLSRPRELVSVTAVSVGELYVGVRQLRAGKRREGLMAAIERTLVAFHESILPYDDESAREYAVFQELRRASGQPLSVEDGMIAAICSTHGARLATRNGKDFAGLGLDIVDPWAPESS